MLSPFTSPSLRSDDTVVEEVTDDVTEAVVVEVADEAVADVEDDTVEALVDDSADDESDVVVVVVMFVAEVCVVVVDSRSNLSYAAFCVSISVSYVPLLSVSTAAPMLLPAFSNMPNF